MTDTLVILLVLISLPICFAITGASRAGAKGLLGFAVWLLEYLADRMLRCARWLRDFHAWRIARRAELRREGGL